MSWGWRLIFCLRLGYALGLRQLRGWYMWDFRLKSGITDHKSSAREPNESSMGRRERRIFQYFSWENHLEMVGFSVHGSWWVFWGGSPRRSTCTRPSLEWRSTSLMVATCCDCSWCLEWPGMKVEGKMIEVCVVSFSGHYEGNGSLIPKLCWWNVDQERSGPFVFPTSRAVAEKPLLVENWFQDCDTVAEEPKGLRYFYSHSLLNGERKNWVTWSLPTTW